MKQNTRVAELQALVAQLARVLDDEPSVQWHRQHDKNHELYLKAHGR
jgi:hypothetical protein